MGHKSFNIVSLFLTILFLSANLSSLAKPGLNPHLTQQKLSKLASIDGKTLIDKMHEHSSSLASYCVNYKMQVFKKRKSILEKGTLYFKNPRLIRIEEQGPYKKGAVAVLTSSGKVKAHLGGALKFIVVELSSNSHLLKSANGHPMVESDLNSLTTHLKSYVKKGMTVTQSKIPVSIPGIKEKVFILDIRKDKNAAFSWKQIAVDPKSYLPIQWWDYDEEGKLYSLSTWQKITTNRLLPDELFTIKQAKSAKKQLDKTDKKKAQLTRHKTQTKANSG